MVNSGTQVDDSSWEGLRAAYRHIDMRHAAVGPGSPRQNGLRELCYNLECDLSHQLLKPKGGNPMSILDGPISRRQMLRASAAVPAAMLLAKAASAGAVERIGSTSRRINAAATTMTMSDWWGSQFGHYFPQMQKLTGVSVDQQLYPYSTTKLFTQVDAGSAADIFLVDSHWNGTLLPEANKVLVPFDAALKSAKVDMSKWNISPND